MALILIQKMMRNKVSNYIFIQMFKKSSAIEDTYTDDVYINTHMPAKAFKTCYNHGRRLHFKLCNKKVLNEQAMLKLVLLN